MGFDEREIAAVRFRLASERWEREQAFRLLHDAYVRRGILAPEDNKMRFSPFSVLPTTALFVAVRGQQVLGTMTLIEDTPAGVPMEETHPEEIAAVRAEGATFAEVGALAVSEPRRRKGIALMMYNLMFRWAQRHRGIGRLAIAVHPSAADFYGTVLRFRARGPVRLYASLTDAPSAPLSLDLERAPERFRALYDRRTDARPSRNLYRFFCDAPFPEIELPPASHAAAPPEWTRSDLRYFIEQLDARPRGIPAAQGKLLLHHYPFLDAVFHADGTSRSRPSRIGQTTPGAA